MVKAIGAVMTGFACGCLGFRMSMMLKTRLKSLSDICASLEALESEINFSVNRLKRALKQADRNGLFTMVSDKIEERGANKAWRGAVNDMKDKLCLTDADSDILLMLGNIIGKTDTEDQIKNIRYIKNLLSKQEEQARGEYSRYARLYAGGGVLVGLMVVIILI